MQFTAVEVKLYTGDGKEVYIPIAELKNPLSENLLEIGRLKQQAAKLFNVSPWRVGVLDNLGKDYLSAMDTVDLESERLKDGVNFTVILHKGAEKTINIDSSTIGRVSSESLLQSHINHLKEDLGIGRNQQSQQNCEVALVITDWTSTMPSVITDFLVEFLESRADCQNGMFLVHLDLHGKMPRILDAMVRNRVYYESVASSLETLEVSVLEVDPETDFLPQFPNLRALRFYKPEFPIAVETDNYSTRLLNLNIDSLDDVAAVAVDSNCHTFENILGRLAHVKQSNISQTGSTLWMVGKLGDICTGLSKLGDHLKLLRERLEVEPELAFNSFLLRLSKLNIHLDGEGSSNHIREVAKVALLKGLNFEQQQKRRKVLTSIRTTVAARVDNQMLMCLFDVLPLSIGLMTENGTSLYSSEAAALVAAVLTAKISAEDHILHVSCTNFAGVEVLSADFDVASLVATLVDVLRSQLGWMSAHLFMEHQWVDHGMSLQNYELLTMKQVNNAIMTRGVERNSTVPTKKVHTFTTSADNQGSALIQIFEGERVFTRDNHLLGTFQLDGLPPAPRGTLKIEVVFDIDSNGILKVSARHAQTGMANAITIPNERGRLNGSDIDRMVEDSDQFWAEEQEPAARMEARRRLFNMCMDGGFEQLGDAKDSVVQETLNWLGKNPAAGKDEIENRRDDILGKITLPSPDASVEDVD